MSKKYTHILNIYVLKFRLDSAGMLVFGGSPQAYLSPMGLRSGLLVSDGACQFLMKHSPVSYGSPFRHVGLRMVSNLISDRFPIITIFPWTHQFMPNTLIAYYYHQVNSKLIYMYTYVRDLFVKLNSNFNANLQCYLKNIYFP